MNIKLSFLGIILLTYASVFSNQSLAQKNTLAKLFGYLASTKVIYLFDKYIQNILQQQLHKIIPYGNELASSEYQILGQEAQTEIGIPKEYQVPIKILSPQNPIIKYVGAMAETDGIYINKKKLDKAKYGIKRSLFFHEAVHKKYNDLSFDQILELLVFFSSTTCTYALLKKIDKIYSKPWYVRWGVILLVGMIANHLSSSKFHKFIERRADIEGFYASGCHVCVKDMALRRKKLFEEQNHPFKNNGYLFYDELEKIAQELEKEAKICEYHKNN